MTFSVRAYDNYTQELEAEVTPGEVYRYHPVTPDMYSALLLSPDAARWFTRFIEPRVQRERVTLEYAE